MKTKFKKGDRVVVVGNESGDAPMCGTTGTVKRKCSHRGDLYVVSFDGGYGWADHSETGTGWNIKEVDIELFDGELYDTDE